MECTDFAEQFRIRVGELRDLVKLPLANPMILGDIAWTAVSRKYAIPPGAELQHREWHVQIHE